MCANGLRPREQIGSPSAHRSIPRPLYGGGATDTGLLNLAPGLPNTAMAATFPARLLGSGGAEPNSPIRSPTGGSPTSMLTIAAPWEYPPSTTRVAGQFCAR